MADPLDVLRSPVTPVEPAPAFAASLRDRIVRALALPAGVAVSSTTLADHSTSEADDGWSADAGAAVPYLAVDGALRAIEWYADVLGASLRGDPVVGPDGRVGHAELAVGAGVFYLADVHPEIGFVAPDPGASTVSLVLGVPDVDATIARAVTSGGRLTREPYEDYGSRNAVVVDPFGHRWMLRTPLAATARRRAGYRHGDVVYASLWVPDVDRAAAFYASVLGWLVTPGDPGRSHRVEDRRPSLGVWNGGEPTSTLFCCYAVDDVAAAVAAVRAAGGQADEPQRAPHGLVADCVDDQGVRFAVYQLTGDEGPRPPANGERHGDLGYLTLQVVDSAKARAFYGAVLGWRFAPGRVEDGWQVEDTVPMTGLSGGHDKATGVPMWRVDDIAAAVERVRAAGGTSTAPQQQPYGVIADCTDDQGGRFYLGELRG